MLQRILTALVLLGFLTTTHQALADEQTDLRFWYNTGDELLAIAASPCQGTWPGYLTAASFGAGLVIALQHDRPWYDGIQAGRSDWQGKVMPIATLAGDGFVQVAGLVALYQYGQPADRKAATLALEGQVEVAVVAFVLKQVFMASRPGDTDRHWFTGQFGDSSFPSGHSMSAFATAVILGDAYHAEWLTYPLAALVAYSRMYNQAHWPADVLAGAGLGILIGNTVLAYHASLTPSNALKLSAIPQPDGGLVVVTWNY